MAPDGRRSIRRSPRQVGKEPFRNSITGIILLGVIASLIASFIWEYKDRRPQPAAVSTSPHEHVPREDSGGAITAHKDSEQTPHDRQGASPLEPPPAKDGAQHEVPDFSGTWLLNLARSNQTAYFSLTDNGMIADGHINPEAELGSISITQTANEISEDAQVGILPGGRHISIHFPLDGSESRFPAKMPAGLSGNENHVVTARWDGRSMVVTDRPWGDTWLGKRQGTLPPVHAGIF